MELYLLSFSHIDCSFQKYLQSFGKLFSFLPTKQWYDNHTIENILGILAYISLHFGKITYFSLSYFIILENIQGILTIQNTKGNKNIIESNSRVQIITENTTIAYKYPPLIVLFLHPESLVLFVSSRSWSIMMVASSSSLIVVTFSLVLLFFNGKYLKNQASSPTDELYGQKQGKTHQSN
jgi:hypothetical protein